MTDLEKLQVRIIKESKTATELVARALAADVKGSTLVYWTLLINMMELSSRVSGNGKAFAKQEKLSKEQKEALSDEEKKRIKNSNINGMCKLELTQARVSVIQIPTNVKTIISNQNFLQAVASTFPEETSKVNVLVSKKASAGAIMSLLNAISYSLNSTDTTAALGWSARQFFENPNYGTFMLFVYAMKCKISYKSAAKRVAAVSKPLMKFALFDNHLIEQIDNFCFQVINNGWNDVSPIELGNVDTKKADEFIRELHNSIKGINLNIDLFTTDPSAEVISAIKLTDEELAAIPETKLESVPADAKADEDDVEVPTDENGNPIPTGETIQDGNKTYTKVNPEVDALDGLVATDVQEAFEFKEEEQPVKQKDENKEIPTQEEITEQTEQQEETGSFPVEQLLIEGIEPEKSILYNIAKADRIWNELRRIAKPVVGDKTEVYIDKAYRDIWSNVHPFVFGGYEPTPEKYLYIKACADALYIYKLNAESLGPTSVAKASADFNTFKSFVLQNASSENVEFLMQHVEQIILPMYVIERVKIGKPLSGINVNGVDGDFCELIISDAQEISEKFDNSLQIEDILNNFMYCGDYRYTQVIKEYDEKIAEKKKAEEDAKRMQEEAAKQAAIAAALPEEKPKKGKIVNMFDKVKGVAGEVAHNMNSNN